MEKEIISKLQKIGDKTEYNSWRGITLLPTINIFFQELYRTEGNTKLMQN